MMAKNEVARRTAAAILTLAVSGCVNSAQVVKRFDLDPARPVGVEITSVTSKAALPSTYIDRFRLYLERGLAARDLAAPGRPATHALEIEITEWRFAGPFRLIPRRDKTVSTFRLRDKATGAVVGEATVESGSYSPFLDLAFFQAKAIARLVSGKTSEPMRKKEASR